ncbi:MAG: TolC family protein, partial [Deefgea sp.]
WAARLAQLEQKNAAQILKSLEDIAQDQARQLKAGEVSPLDANLANQAVLEAQLQLAQRQQELKAHLQHFHSLVGEPIPVPMQDEDLPAQLDVIHPQRVVLQAELELARAHLAQSQYDTRDNPELALSLTRERGSPGEEFKNLGKISLRIPLGSDGRTKARISSANAELISAQANTQRTERQITAQQQAAEQARQFASQSAQWAEQSLKLATQAWEWQQRSYRAGQTGLAAYLNAQRDFLARSFAVQRAQLELGRAQSRYLQTMGVLP